MKFDFQAIVNVWPYLMQGLWYTLSLTFWGILLSSVIGVVCAVMRISKNRLVRWCVVTYIEVFRSTPIVAQVFFLYFALPLMGVKISAFACGLISLVLYYNAYNIEVFRSGLEAVPHGLWEAAEALGFGHIQRLRLVVIPIALRISLPSLVNNYVSLLKNTALVSIIGVTEITFVTQDVIADNFTFLEMYATAGVVYLVLVFGVTWVLRRVEKRYALLMS